MLFRSEQELDEPYLQPGVTTKSSVYNDFVVPEGYVFAMGDNRGFSSDCRDFGCIPLEKIEGKVILRIWPITQFGVIR